jgi:hypothetical protein
LTRSAATDAAIDSQNRLPPVFTGDQVAAVERLPKISTDRMLLLVGALALTVATSRLIFKYAAARRPRRGDIFDQRGPAWEWTGAITLFLSVGRIDTSSQRRLRSTRAERAGLRD